MHAPTVATSTSAAYRADIDGLRAVAVLLVVVFHAFPNERFLFLPGGFIGVDVFFVISGYLISKILFTEIEDGRFSIASFYGRRARRIFPALAVCLVAVLAYGFLVLLPSELAQLGKQTFFGAAFLSNLALWQESGYFDAAATSKPLLHLWSLGIEEQFYIIWPILLLLAFRLKTSFSGMIAFLFAASFLTNIALSVADVTSDFYLPISRFWELLAGAALARHQEAIVIQPRYQNILSFSGLGAILASAALFTSEMRFPGWWALIPVAGASAIILAGPSAVINRKLLANRKAVSIGLISYPLYLWHWPLIAFSYIVRGKPPSLLLAFGLITVSLLLSWATYALIERPVRFGPSRKQKTLAACVILSVVGGCGLVTWLAGGIPQRFPTGLDFSKINAATLDSTYAATSGMVVLETNSRKDYPLLSRIGHGNRTVAFVGNSSMLHYGPRVQQLSDEGKLRALVYFVTAPGCQPVPGIVDPTEFVDCGVILRKMKELTQREKVDAIVLSASYVEKRGASISGNDEQVQLEGHAGARRFYANLENYVRELQRGSQVYLVLGAPYSPTHFDPHRMIERGITGLRMDRSTAVTVSLRELRAVNASNDEELRAVAARTGAILLDPFPDICREGEMCSPFFGASEPKFIDGAHLRPSFVKRHVQFFDFLLTSGPQ